MVMIKLTNQDLVKLDRFNGTNFTRWQDKLKFLLTSLKIFYVYDPELVPIPEPTDEDSDELKAESKNGGRTNSYAMGTSSTLSPILSTISTPTRNRRGIYGTRLISNIKAEEEGINKFLISKYFDFKMVDDKPILVQVHELQVLANKLRAVKIDITETFQLSAIIAKLSPTWNGYRKKLLHNSEDYSLEQL